MKATSIVIHSVLFGMLTGLGAAQDPVRAESTTPPPETSSTATAEEVDGWIRKLGDASYRNRKAAEASLARIGKAALPALEKAAESHDDNEVRWRARRLTQQIQQADAPSAVTQPPRRLQPFRPQQPTPPGQGGQGGQGRPGGQSGQFGPDLDDVFDRVFERLERDFQIDVPRRSFFGDSFFQDLQRQMDEMRQQMGGSSGAMQGSGESMSMQMGPDGVRVEVRKRGTDGKEDVKVYEAPDLETLRAQNPEIGRVLGGVQVFRFPQMDPGAGGFFRVQPGTQPRVLRDWMRNRGGQPQGQIDTPVTPDVAPDTKDRLGVTVRDAISDDLREFLGLESGVGLMVEDVIDGTLAQRLGLVRGDVVVEVAGRKVGTSEDVRAAVQSVGSGEKVVVSINRKGKSMQVSAVKSEAAKDEAQEDEPKTRVR
jgi:hypothetical protein